MSSPTVLVTGAGPGSLGEATARLLREQSFRVVTTSRSCPETADTHALDLTSASSVQDLRRLAGGYDGRPARRARQQRRDPPRPAQHLEVGPAPRRARDPLEDQLPGDRTPHPAPAPAADRDRGEVRRGARRERRLQAPRARSERVAVRRRHAVRLMGRLRHLEAGTGSRGRRDRKALRRDRCARLLAPPGLRLHQDRRPGTGDRASAGSVAEAVRATRAQSTAEPRAGGCARPCSARPLPTPCRVVTTAAAARRSRRRTPGTPPSPAGCGTRRRPGCRGSPSRHRCSCRSSRRRRISSRSDCTSAAARGDALLHVLDLLDALDQPRGEGAGDHTEHADAAEHQAGGDEATLTGDRVHVAVPHGGDRRQRPPDGVAEGLDRARADRARRRGWPATP